MPANIIFWDNETTNLNANFGFLLTFGWKSNLEKSPHVITIADYPTYRSQNTNDKRLVKEAARILSEADLWVTHYGNRFDIPYLNSRLIYHRLPPLPPIPNIDTWKIARYELRLNSNRLDTVSKFVNTQYGKTPVDGEHWIKAIAGNKASLKYIVQHNKYDVLVLEEVYNRIRPMMRNHPNVNLVDEQDGCPTCGSNNLQKRGFHIARTRKYQRIQCKDCGSWSRLSKSEKVKLTIT